MQTDDDILEDGEDYGGCGNEGYCGICGDIEDDSYDDDFDDESVFDDEDPDF